MCNVPFKRCGDMPKVTRKYPSKKKTTTQEGYREYKKLQMREYRARKKRVSQKKMGLVDEIERAVNLPEIVAITQKTLDEGVKRLKKLIDEVKKRRSSGDYSKLEELKKEVKRQTEILQIVRVLNHVMDIMREMKQIEKINQLEKVMPHV